MYSIHQNIKNKLDYFIQHKTIPNIIFHGENGSGKKTLLKYFLNKIYDKVEDKDSYIMNVNCHEGKGIKFIREELKFFAKTNIHTQQGKIIKSIILYNAEKLTIDAQSALRRCIELFTNNTRFFIIVERKEKILKPILSRFCDIFIPKPMINDKICNLHILKKMNITNNNNKKVFLNKKIKDLKFDNIFELTNIFYNKGYYCNEICELLIKNIENDMIKYTFLVYYNKVRQDIKNEKILINYLLNIYLIRNSLTLENISTM